jgi:hypothetical protein
MSEPVMSVEQTLAKPVRRVFLLSITLGIVGIVVLMGGAAFASYYMARRVGLPVLAALVQRRQQQR